MLSILLLILKIIGISLLCILGLILLVIVLVLFVPLRYKADVNYESTLLAAARVRWLWPLVNVKVTVNGKKLKIVARVLGIPVFVQDPDENPEKKRKKEEKKEQKRRKKEEKERRKEEKKAKKRAGNDEEHVIIKENECPEDNRSADNSADEHSADNPEDNRSADDAEDNRPGDDSADNRSADDSADNRSADDSADIIPLRFPAEYSDDSAAIRQEQESGFSEHQPESKFGQIISSIKKIFGKIKSVFLKLGTIFKKIKNIAGNIGHKKDVLLRFWNSGKNRKAFRFLLGILKKVLKHIMPKKIKGTVEFGMDDPSSTGKILGGVYAFYGYIPKKLHIYPDFTGKRVFADVTVCGRIRLFTLLRYGLKVLRSREFKYLRKQIDKLTAELKSNKAA